jgi:small subunit ribosomal protein S2
MSLKFAKASSFCYIVSMQKTKTAKETSENEAIIEAMFKVGAHYGYSKTRRHPSVSSYIFTTKNKGDIINLEKTNELLEEAALFVKNLGAQNKTVLFVGTKPEAKVAIKDVAESLNMPYVTERWIGGTLSNFTEIKKRILELENYQKDTATGGLDKYTKKERVVMAKKMEKLARYYTGLLGLKKAPDALFVIDAKSEHIAATEARKSGIPVIALVNSDSNIKGLDYPVVGNDAAIPSIKFFSSAIGSAYKEGQTSVPVTK